jgi:hypothetical protein
MKKGSKETLDETEENLEPLVKLSLIEIKFNKDF